MKSWSGLEQIFRLSLGIEIGAYALSLVAALEFKQRLQEDLQERTEQNTQVTRLSSDEWRAAAGIFDRKAFDRAKTKLINNGIIRVEQDQCFVKRGAASVIS